MREPTHVSLAALETLAADLLLVGCFQGEAPPTAGAPPDLASALERLAARSGFRGKENQHVETLIGGASGVSALAVRGLGKREQLDAVTLRGWVCSAVDAARRNGVARLGLLLPAHAETTGPAAAQRLLRWVMVCGYRYESYLTKRDEVELRLAEVQLVPPVGEGANYQSALAPATALAKAVILAREIGNAPPNEAVPEWLEKTAERVAEHAGMELEVLDLEDLERLRMGGILAVGRGSARPPRLLKLRYGSSGPRVALVGKGITFDTGGISIKPAASMEEMKYDKCGAVTVLALAALVAEQRLPVQLRAYLPVAENMPDGDSYRPGDIITCYNGKTVEITNTDAEGRMVLADALALAVEEGAEHLLEFSTLTGACMVALGRHAAGLYTPEDALASELLTAAERAGERLWRMPLWPEIGEQTKGTHADLKNSGERWGSANFAAAFLAQFVGNLARWAHLDIAGPANTSAEGPEGLGATGYGISLGFDWINSLARR